MCALNEIFHLNCNLVKIRLESFPKKLVERKKIFISIFAYALETVFRKLAFVHNLIIKDFEDLIICALTIL